MIDLISANKLAKDFVKYETAELVKLSDADLSAYLESLVAELLKHLKNGAIHDNKDAENILDLIDDYMKIAKIRFSNADALLNNRKFLYVISAYCTANIQHLNHLYDVELLNIISVVTEMVCDRIFLRLLLKLYYSNYSNHRMINELFFDLSAADDVDLTFNIQKKYIDKYSVNDKLICDLDYIIKLKIDNFLQLMDYVEIAVDVDEIAGESYFDDKADAVKSNLKTIFNNVSDFEKIALIESGYDDALFHQLSNTKTEIDIIKMFIDVKEWFMNLNNNGFSEISAGIFEILQSENPDRYNDFDKFMQYEPKYDLQKCKLILPEKNNKVY